MTALLTVRDLRVAFLGPTGRMIHALNGVTVEVCAGEVLGILGESGCGKSTLAKAVLALLPENARTAGGAVEFEAKDLLRLPAKEMSGIRGARISLIGQDPGHALNPVLKVGTQIAEVLRAHRDWSGTRCRAEAELLLEQVGLVSVGRRMFDAYPHQLSGGQQQRVAIAQAIACKPALIVADEPTASLDAATALEILKLLQKLRAEHGMSIILITHDPGILEGMADRVAILYAGRIVEQGEFETVVAKPQHPYTQALLRCVRPKLASVPLRPGEHLATIPGQTPNPEDMATNRCSFAPRCDKRMVVCDRMSPSPVELGEGQSVECFLHGQ